ncbi:hypothetical protein ACFU8T_12185 [Sphingobacterium spiritivorum]|nr:hypothetical protein [Sphingobacterium spiritivorum]QQT34321.1 hypothetical protein I6J01_13370 [Sphingobacterium spiritivorum]WQD35163.1 hypothetical protein U0038_05310 [Sphingobacterium spiritivorum]SUI99512.1 Uncharacterised protein [Sphingobacterium spiritivorum]
MKNIISKSLLMLPVLLIMSCGAKKDPAEYNNELMTVINGGEKNITEMNSAMQAGDFDKAGKVQQEWSTALDKDIKKVEEIGDFNGDANLQTAILTGLKGYKKIVAEDYPKLIDLRKNKKEDPATEQQLLNNINNALEVMANGVNEASGKFERDHAKK